MMRLTLAVAVFGAADAFQATAGLPSRRNAMGRSKVAMQVAESLVASPVALAKVCSGEPRPSVLCVASCFQGSDSPLAICQAADEARGLAIDSISSAHSGHMGLPLGCAEIGAVLFGQEM